MLSLVHVPTAFSFSVGAGLIEHSIFHPSANTSASDSAQGLVLPSKFSQKTIAF